jgi:hypothetical protein
LNDVLCFGIGAFNREITSDTPAKAAVEGERQGELGADFGSGSPKKLALPGREG